MAETAAGYVAQFTEALQVTIAGAVHGLGTADLLYQLYTATDPPAAFDPGSFRVDPLTFTVSVTFATPQSGRLVLLPVLPGVPTTPPTEPLPPLPPPGTGGLEPALAALLTETVSHSAYVGQSGYGAPVYGPATLRRCRVEFRVAPMVTATGEERTSSTRIFFDSDFTLNLRDRIVLEDNTAPQIQAIYRPRDEFGQVHHQEALF